MHCVYLALSTRKIFCIYIFFNALYIYKFSFVHSLNDAAIELRSQTR